MGREDGTPDDARGWFRGRSVPWVEEQVVRALLVPTRSGWCLDAGTGNGRLVDCLTFQGDRVVAVDRERRRLLQVRKDHPDSGRVRLVQADLRRPPFREGTFATILCVRVLHRLGAPVRSLQALHALMPPDGVLVVSYHPRPSARSLELAFWRHLRGAAGSGPLENVPQAVDASQDPPGNESRASITAALYASGFTPERELDCGLEELPILRWLPGEIFLRMTFVFRTSRAFPTVFLRARQVPREPGGPNLRRSPTGAPYAPDARGANGPAGLPGPTAPPSVPGRGALGGTD